MATRFAKPACEQGRDSFTVASEDAQGPKLCLIETVQTARIGRMGRQAEVAELVHGSCQMGPDISSSTL